ncbi:hypothetical protein OIU79_015394 [Salix purpurea]|uniref:Uncharacterized protein n=1 Tax=Salix purpurea TaxID=77065 RepID=A0A9Q0SQ77_SALPP|nr:hypothetical protein OIU79_015394 [Salix purpurea]
MYMYSKQGKYYFKLHLISTSWRVGRGGFTKNLLQHLLHHTTSLGRCHRRRRLPKSPFSWSFTSVSCGIIAVLAADFTHPADLWLDNPISYLLSQIKKFWK